jgi:hypothetical protein
VFNICYNHFLATIVKPGSPTDLKKVEILREQYKRRQNRKLIRLDDDRFDSVSTDVKRLLRYRHKTTSDLLTSDKQCKHCKLAKPVRTHHCSICNQCVLVMDHHCPWINNCVGVENRRYFLLFCFYLFVGAAYMLITL